MTNKESIIESYSPREIEQYLREELGISGVVSSSDESRMLVTLEMYVPDDVTSNDLPGKWTVQRREDSDIVRFAESD